MKQERKLVYRSLDVEDLISGVRKEGTVLDTKMPPDGNDVIIIQEVFSIDVTPFDWFARLYFNFGIAQSHGILNFLDQVDTNSLPPLIVAGLDYIEARVMETFYHNMVNDFRQNEYIKELTDRIRRHKSGLSKFLDAPASFMLEKLAALAVQITEQQIDRVEGIFNGPDI